MPDGFARLRLVDVAAEGFAIPAQRVQIHRVDVVLMRVDQDPPGHAELALLVVHEQQAVVPAVGPRLVHDRRDIARGRVR